jgi:large subunit ribosomal protein L17
MRHLKQGRKLSRVKSQRVALMRTMLGSLIMREKIETTEAKAKEIKNKIDRIIGKAKKGIKAEKKMVVRRDLKKYIPDMAAKKITGDFVEKFKDRNSGYTRIIKLVPRKSDGAKLAVIEFV